MIPCVNPRGLFDESSLVLTRSVRIHTSFMGKESRLFRGITNLGRPQIFADELSR